MDASKTKEYRYHLDHVFYPAPLQLGSLSLVQLGRLYCRAGSVVDTHLHKEYMELTIVTGGEGKVYANDVPIDVKSGDIYLSFPFERHKIESSEINPLNYDFCAFFAVDEEKKKELEIIVKTFAPIEFRVFSDERIRTLVGNAIAEFVDKKRFYLEVMTRIFEEIFYYIVRDFSDARKPDFKNASENEILCYQVMHYIDTHLYSLERLEDLASVTNYNYSYLSSVFRKTTKNTLLSYYHDKRLDVARLLILERKLKISEIAETLGYSSVYSFSKAFKKKYGISPRGYIKK